MKNLYIKYHKFTNIFITISHNLANFEADRKGDILFRVSFSRKTENNSKYTVHTFCEIYYFLFSGQHCPCVCCTQLWHQHTFYLAKFHKKIEDFFQIKNLKRRHVVRTQ